MGLLNAPPRTEFRVIMEGYGRIMGPMGAHDRSKFWLKEDGTLVLAVLNKANRVERQHYTVSRADFDKSKRAAFETPEGRWNFHQADCTCGYGSLAYATIEEGRVTTTRVRPPEWVTGL